MISRQENVPHGPKCSRIVLNIMRRQIYMAPPGAKQLRGSQSRIQEFGEVSIQRVDS